MRKSVSGGTFAALIALGGLPANANEFAPMLESLAAGDIRTILSEPALIAAINAQNQRHQGLDEAAILELDQKWRSEIGQSTTPTIDSVMTVQASDLLRAARDASGGLFTEIFLMDRVGLNVASSDVTSDFWQGDEAKWQQTFGAGPGAIHIGDIELDESTQTYQSQVSVAITDPATNAVIGAATFGVNVELMN